MAVKKIITVVGGTGNQGRSVVESFLAQPNWHVRAMTRDPSSEKAKAIASLGAELVKADLQDPKSLDAAFAGSHAIFLNTDYWVTWYPLKAQYDAAGNKDIASVSQKAYDVETSGGRNAADAATRVSTLERLVVSSLPSTSRASNGKYTHSLHTEAKADIVRYIEEKLPALAAKTSIIILGAYATNRFLIPTKDPASGKYQFVLPMRADTIFPVVDPNTSTGPFVHALIEHEAPGTKLLAYDRDSKLMIRQIVATWARATGREAEFVPVTTAWMEQNRGATREHLDAIDQISEGGYLSFEKDFIEPHQLKVPVTTASWEEWLRRKNWDEELGA
ncbi:hypothetical protein MRB53_042012 [Persea americana]|nr:hypothetical protein MRB53_042012 [Persea americana]